MRRFAGSALIALFLAVAPAGQAFGLSAEQASPAVAAVTVQAQGDEEDSDNEGLWGLLGLLGLAGLIPWRKNRDQQTHRGGSGGGRSTGI